MQMLWSMRTSWGLRGFIGRRLCRELCGGGEGGDVRGGGRGEGGGEGGGGGEGEGGIIEDGDGLCR